MFENNLNALRKLVPVSTICMHGSPLSKYDNKLLWKYYNYRDFGIIGEPYFDIDFSKVLYLTDTGRRWNGDAVSIRDKVSNSGRVVTPLGPDSYRDKGVRRESGKIQDAGFKPQDFNYRTTHDIIKATEKNELPDQIMFTFHPQRWTDKPLPWAKELVLQNMKNVAKYFFNKIRE